MPGIGEVVARTLIGVDDSELKSILFVWIDGSLDRCFHQRHVSGHINRRNKLQARNQKSYPPV